MSLAKRKPPISPLAAFSCIWLGVLLLYSLNISSLQIYQASAVAETISLIMLPFLIFYTLGSVITSTLPRKIRPVQSNIYSDDTKKLKTTVRYSTMVFASIVLFEVAIEGYIPLLSMLAGRVISQFEFGISSLHGLCLALGTLNVTLLFYLRLKTKSKESLLLLAMHIFIFLLLVTRKMVVISLIQMLFVYLCVGSKRIPRNPIPILIAALVGIFIFGWVGDVRTGRSLFLSLANLRFEYPDWLPSGLIWVYIYCITPILNLTNAFYSTIAFSYDLQFICSVIPSIFRSAFGCSTGALGFENEYQISGAFNIATGYISLYESWGKLGIAIFSAAHGALASHVTLTFREQAKKVIFYSIFMQVTVLLIFSNGFFNLNVLAQFFILPIIFHYAKKSRNKLIPDVLPPQNDAIKFQTPKI
ncbi:hypothetical protein D3C75_463750 [compost metagenome]